MHRTFSDEYSDEALEYLYELRYRREFHLSAQEYAAEPMEALLKARLAWEMEAERDKLEKERQAFKASQ